MLVTLSREVGALGFTVDLNLYPKTIAATLAGIKLRRRRLLNHTPKLSTQGTHPQRIALCPIDRHISQHPPT